MVKGYEFAKDQYVMFTPEELKALEEAGTHTVDITEFVPLEAVDPVYFDKAYYLAPDKGGAKPYALLAEALRESKRCALGRWAARGKQYIVMIRPVGRRARHAAAALRRRGALDQGHRHPEDRGASDAELKLAQQLIEQQAADDVRPERSTRTRCASASRRRSQKKVEGQEITLAEAPRAGGAQVIDLMEALRASLEKKAGAKARGAARQREARPSPRKPRPRRAGRARNSADRAPVRRARRARSCCACRAARSARWSTPASSRPARGPRNAWRFSFQDLIVLRTAQALADGEGAAAAHHALR